MQLAQIRNNTAPSTLHMRKVSEAPARRQCRRDGCQNKRLTDQLAKAISKPPGCNWRVTDFSCLRIPQGKYHRPHLAIGKAQGAILDSAMPYEFKVQRRVEFSDTDMAGIMHYSNFFRFMETAEHAFFRSLGFSIAPGGALPNHLRVGWPRVHASCDYHRPLRFEDVVEIHLLVAEKKSKAITYDIRFQKLNGANSEQVARGRLTVVCVAHDEASGAMKAIHIPVEIAARVEVAPKDLLAR
jgi:acyl-CoA thioester hydrolase